MIANKSKLALLISLLLSSSAYADESLLDKVRGAETMPEGAWELIRPSLIAKIRERVSTRPRVPKQKSNMA